MVQDLQRSMIQGGFPIAWMLCISFTTNLKFSFCTWKIFSEKQLREKKVVSSSVILNATLFSDIMAPVKDFSIALQNNSFNIVDATTKITEFIDIYKNMLNSLKHWQKICILVFIYPKTDARKRQRDLPKHENNKLCSHSRFTYQKCNPIRWIDYRLSPKPL